jgi:hypothetical protein
MSGQKSWQSGGARQVERLSNISIFGGGPRISRTALLAGASLVALAALAAPDQALAACSGHNRSISSPSTPGPVFGKGGNITVDAGASIAGGPTGVYAENCGIGALSNS